MQKDSDNGSCFGFVSLSHQTDNHTGQHISAAGRCHTRITCGIDVNIPLRRTDCRIGTFEDNALRMFHSHFGSFMESFISVDTIPEQPVQLFRVRRQNSTRGQQREELFMLCQDIQRVGIKEQWLSESLQQLLQHLHGLLFRSQSRSGGDNVIPVRIGEHRDTVIY